MPTPQGPRVLITSGPTWVPIDPVRVIGNRSSGRMGRLLAEAFRRRGAAVTLLEGPVERPSRGGVGIEVMRFRFFDELAALLEREVRDGYDVCLHAAAVSDYRVRRPRKVKIASGLRDLRLDLRPTPKLIRAIRGWDPRVFLVGFKLEPKIDAPRARTKALETAREAGCDLVLLNAVTDGAYSGCLLDPSGHELARSESREGIVRSLVRIVFDALERAPNEGLQS